MFRLVPFVALIGLLGCESPGFRSRGGSAAPVASPPPAETRSRPSPATKPTAKPTAPATTGAPAEGPAPAPHPLPPPPPPPVSGTKG